MLLLLSVSRSIVTAALPEICKAPPLSGAVEPVRVRSSIATVPALTRNSWSPLAGVITVDRAPAPASVTLAPIVMEPPAALVDS